MPPQYFGNLTPFSQDISQIYTKEESTVMLTSAVKIREQHRLFFGVRIRILSSLENQLMLLLSLVGVIRLILLKSKMLCSRPVLLYQNNQSHCTQSTVVLTEIFPPIFFILFGVLGQKMATLNISIKFTHQLKEKLTRKSPSDNKSLMEMVNHNQVSLSKILVMY
jgi:hypothetical protein